MNRGDGRGAEIDNAERWAVPETSVWRERVNNRRRPWSRRIVRKVTRFLSSQDLIGDTTTARQHLPLLLCTLLYLIAAMSALAFGAWAPALVLALGSLGNFACHQRRLTRWQHQHDPA